jgi:hypothetical protein
MKRTKAKKATRNFAALALLVCLAPLFRPGLLRAQSADEKILFDDANRERAQRGLSPLK